MIAMDRIFHAPRLGALIAVLYIAAAESPEAAAQSRLSVAITMTDPRRDGGTDLGSFDGPGLTYVHDVGSSRRWALGFAGAGGTYGSTDRPLEVPFADFRARTHNRTGFYVGILQHKFASGRLQPYLQAAAGYGEFRTETEITCADCSEAPLILVEDLSDGSFVAGGGAGVLAMLFRRDREPVAGPPVDDPDGAFRLDLDLGVRWLRGGEVGFLTADPVFDDDGVLLPESFEEHAIDVLQYQVGASFGW